MKGSKKMAKRLVAMLMAAALTLSLPLLTALQLIAAMPLPKQKI